MEHECAECREKFGSLKFDKTLLYNWIHRPGSRKVCKDCQTKLKCAACNRRFDEKSWTLKERDNHRYQNTKLVCKDCRAVGYRPEDVTKYECQRCHQEFGAQKFDRHMMNHFNSHGRAKLECKQCVQVMAQELKKLKKQLKPSKVRCKCGSRLGHADKCPLTPVYQGQRRWPGCDKDKTGQPYISPTDRDFLNGLNPRPDWWREALRLGSTKER